MVHFLCLFPPTRSQVAFGPPFFHTELKRQGWLIQAENLTALGLQTPGDLSELLQLTFQSTLHGLPCLLENETAAPLRYNAEIAAYEAGRYRTDDGEWDALLNREAACFDRRRFDIMRSEHSYEPAYVDLVKTTVEKIVVGGTALLTNTNDPEAAGLIHGGMNVCGYYGLTRAHQMLRQSLALAKDQQTAHACELAHAAARCLWKSFRDQALQLDPLTQDTTREKS